MALFVASSEWLCNLAKGVEPATAPNDALRLLAGEAKLDAPATAAELDRQLGSLPSFQRGSFHVPKNGTLPQADAALAAPEEECIYLVGNSLGLQPTGVRAAVNEELDRWAQLGVNAHFTGPTAWMPIDELVIAKSAAVVGAQPEEVAIMNSLSVNLHLLFVSFYQPKGPRREILFEGDAFPSDYFAFESQAKLHGLDPSSVLRPLRPRAGETLLRTEDITKAIADAGDALAIVCLGTIQYYTGQFFDVAAITRAAHEVGAYCIWDCAHAAGNLDLHLHDWGVDGACWCTYKYLNAGPGGIGGFFLHEKHHSGNLPSLNGWWGQRQATRFDMAHKWEPSGGASTYRLSNPPVLQTVSLAASLDVFARTTMSELRGRSMLLTGYLEFLIGQLASANETELFSIITPSDPRQRGAQLSVKFNDPSVCNAVFAELEKRGVVLDHRKPNVLRVSPAPLYNTFVDIRRFVTMLSQALASLTGEPPSKKART